MPTDPATRAAAREKVGCDYCNQPAGNVCRTKSGAQATVHAVRVTAYGHWLDGAASRDGEVAGLRSAVQAAVDETSRYSADAAHWEEEYDDAVRVSTALNARVSDLTDENRSLKDWIAAHQPGPAPSTQRTLFGAGGGNKDRTKDGIALDRRYYGAGDTDKAVADAKRNHAAGILTWASFKLPHSWTDMAAGKGDDWADTLYAKLAALGFEVWVAFHHEPEGDGDTNLWRQLQDRLSRRVPGGIDGDLKFWLVVTGWTQEFNPKDTANQWSTLYPTGAPIYGIAYDNPYLKYGLKWVSGKQTATMETEWTEGAVYVDKLAERAASLGVHAAIGEMGYSDEAFAKDKTWLAKVLERAAAKGLLGVSYFDTPLNSKKSWTLGAADSPKRAYFTSLIAARNPNKEN